MSEQVTVNELLDRVRHVERRQDNLEDDLADLRTIRSHHQELNGELRVENNTLRGQTQQYKQTLTDVYTLLEDGTPREDVLERIDTTLDGGA